MKSLMPRMVAVLFVFIIGSFVFIHTNAGAEISVESYCQLCIEVMQQEIAHFQELIPLVNQYKSDPALLQEEENNKQNEFQEARDSLFDSFGVKGSEYAFFMGKHEREVSAYLEKHSPVKQKIDYLSGEVNSLLEEYENQKGR